MQMFEIFNGFFFKSKGSVKIIHTSVTLSHHLLFHAFFKGLLAYFAYGRYRQGVREFDQEYRDPATDHTTPYPPGPYAGTGGPASYQQSPFSHSQEQPGEYQPPTY